MTMVRPAHDDSLPLSALVVTARLVRRAAPKRRVAELDIQAQQASGGRRGGCRRAIYASGGSWVTPLHQRQHLQHQRTLHSLEGSSPRLPAQVAKHHHHLQIISNGRAPCVCDHKLSKSHAGNLFARLLHNCFPSKSSIFFHISFSSIEVREMSELR
ncbi:uncharacterized protein [Oryza sativa Japonica Group]|uniref:uncharacterized protein isoform X1 n=1 Tax=Oryza sativa subsp. japonica TaxID=39947 RepID=UPI0007753F92|nr:uncharacterized protein LOC107281141 isoform X1 [Oryza sativa Japonica Group]